MEDEPEVWIDLGVIQQIKRCLMMKCVKMKWRIYMCILESFYKENLK